MSYILDLYPTPGQRVFYVGDIHGNYGLYERGLKTFGITDDDIVISCGDVIDRGDQSTKTLLEFFNKPNRYMVLGNHESMALNAGNKDWYEMWTRNGGDKVISEIGVWGIDFLRPCLAQLPYMIVVHQENTKVAVLHAEVPPYITDFNELSTRLELEEQVRSDSIWNNGVFNHFRNKTQKTPTTDFVANIDYMIHGHVAVNYGMVFGNRVYIDSQFLSGELTFAHLDSNKKMQFQKRPRDFMSFVIPGSGR